jgi:hypothetical protein
LKKLAFSKNENGAENLKIICDLYYYLMSLEDDMEFINTFLEGGSVNISLNKSTIQKLTKNSLNFLYFEILEKNSNTPFKICK